MKLDLSNLSVAYTKLPILSKIDAHVSAGEFIGLVGPNGSGKSCLLKTIAGLLPPMKGSVVLDGKNIHSMNGQIRAQQLSYLAQDKTTNWPLPVHALVSLGRTPYRGSLGKLSIEDKQAIDVALHHAQCHEIKDRRFDHLSGGEQMRVHLARTLAVDASLILADEPNTALDPYYQISMIDTLAGQVKAGKTVIASLHDLSLAKQFCSRIWVLHQGKLVQDQPAENALHENILADVFNIEKHSGGWVTKSKKTALKT